MINRNSIFRNSFWFGLESMIDAGVSLALSVVVARALGPVRLGYYIYLMFLINLAGRLGAFGPGAATRKYLSEYLGRDDRVMARTIFFTMLRWHVALALGLATIGWALTFTFVERSQRSVAAMLVASMIASIINIVASQANMAAQNFRRNVPASMFSLGLYVVAVFLTLGFGWGTPGLAAAFLLRRAVEMAMRLAPAIQWARQLPFAPPPPHLARKLMAFSGQGLAIAALLIVVWDRSELLFLRQFSKIQEVTFYSVAFSVTEALLLLPNVIGAAVSARLMAEYGREDSNFRALSASSIRYIALLVVPMYVGLAALSGAAVRLFYGGSYLPAIPVLQISLVLAVPKAFYWFPSAALQAADRQGVMFRWMLVMAALNLGLDALLIPPYGAVGAALGNGIAQPVAVVVLTIVTARICKVRVPWASLGGTVAMSLTMGAVVYLATRALHPAAALVCGPVLGFFLYLAMLRVTGTFRADDLAFVRQFESRVPARLRGACGAVLEWLTVAPPVPSAELALVATEAEVKNVCAGQGQ